MVHACRLKKQELASLAQSAENVMRAVEESVKRELSDSLEAVAEKPSKPRCERNKIVLSIQDKDGAKQFRIYVVCCAEVLTFIICLSSNFLFRKQTSLLVITGR